MPTGCMKPPVAAAVRRTCVKLRSPSPKASPRRGQDLSRGRARSLRRNGEEGRSGVSACAEASPGSEYVAIAEDVALLLGLGHRDDAVALLAGLRRSLREGGDASVTVSLAADGSKEIALEFKRSAPGGGRCIAPRSKRRHPRSSRAQSGRRSLRIPARGASRSCLLQEPATTLYGLQLGFREFPWRYKGSNHREKRLRYQSSGSRGEVFGTGCGSLQRGRHPAIRIDGLDHWR